MTKNSSDPRFSRSRRALLDAAIDLLLINSSASLSDIAQRAGVGRATLYRHYGAREELLRDLALESLQITDEVLQPIVTAGLSARDTLEQGLCAVMQVADRFHFLLLLWNYSEDDEQIGKVYNRQLKDLHDLIERGKQEGSIDSRLSSSWIVTLIDSLVYAGWWAIYSGEMSAEEAGEHGSRVLFNGIS